MDVFRNRLSQYFVMTDGVWGRIKTLPAKQRSFGPGEDIVRTGDPTDSLFIIEEGWSIRYRLMEDGRRQIVNFMLPGDFFDLQSLADLQSDHNVSTVTATKIRVIPAHTFLSALQENGDIAMGFWWAAVQEESILREQIVRIGQRSARERVCHLLLELQKRLSAASGKSANRFPLPVKRSHIADALGLTHVHVSRTMTQMKKDGLVAEDNHAITIQDRDQLVKIAQFDSDYLHMKKLDVMKLVSQLQGRIAE